MTTPNTNWFQLLRGLRYVGGKLRITKRIGKILQASGGHTLVDVFGGSGAVIMNAGFTKRIYNDIDGDVVNFHRVLADPRMCREFHRWSKRLPMSRQIFDEWGQYYLNNGLSFQGLEPVERAVATFYRSSFCYGGKMRSGGFGVSASDRVGIKEITRHRKVLAEVHRLHEFWRKTCIEGLAFGKLIEAYEKRPGVVFYCDPPYFGTEDIYSRTFGSGDHWSLAMMLNQTPAKVALSYYPCDQVDELYPEDAWYRTEVKATKNSMGGSKGEKQQTTELILTNYDPEGGEE